MTTDIADLLTDRLNPTDMLLQFKALEPLSDAAVAELQRIVNLKELDSYSEMDVREEIITPILRVMGYAKESMFSIRREKWLRILEKGLSADYSITLWQEDFWVIEAKKPNVTNGVFKYDQLWQAVQYAIHPQISAALVVLCDGHALEIYDREHSLESPILRVERENLVRDFDKLRMLLGPLQAWFFQKRRVVRLLDKVFDKEFQLGRMEEFRLLVDRRLRAKEQQTIFNRRALDEGREDNTADRLRTADPVEIVEGVFPPSLPWAMIEAATSSLIDHSAPSPFQVLYRIFPDQPRAANDAFFGHALFYLMRLSEIQTDLLWLPDWLGRTKGGAAKTDDAVKWLIALCLTHFKEDTARKTILLYANAVRRLSKARMVLSPKVHPAGELRHALQRYAGNEFDFAQQVSSPDRHLILSLDSLESISLHRFVPGLIGQNDAFRVESAKLELQQLWKIEQRLLSTVPSYPALLRERDLGEVHPTEACGVRYDQLGHNSLCMLDRFPKWRAYVLAEHKTEVESLAALGSWKAREMLSLAVDDVDLAPDQIFADRFFFGDVDLAIALRDAYGFL